MKKVFYALSCMAVMLVASLPTLNAQSFFVSCKTLTVEKEGGERQFYFTCDSGYVWTVSSNANWVSVSPSMGVTVSAAETVVTLTVDANSGADRTANISFTVGNKTATFPLNQVNTDNYWGTRDLIPLHLGENEPEPRLDGTTTIPVVLVGNGWDLADHKKGLDGDSGLWVRYAQGWSDLFMQQDIIRNMKQYIDVYALGAVSGQSGNVYLTAFKQYIGAHRDGGAMITMATKSLKDLGHPNWQRVVFVDASNQGTGGYNVYYSNGEGATSQVANYGNPESEQSGQYWWAHEFLGHDFSNMPDFYYHNDGIDWTSPLNPYAELKWTAGQDEGPNGTSVAATDERTFTLFARSGDFPTKYTGGSSLSNLTGLAVEWDKGYWWNTDWESDPAKVVWKKFIELKNEGKGYSQVDVFSGGNWNGIDGFKRPENHNIMNENYGSDCTGNVWADVGHRLWLWNRLLRRAGVAQPHLVSAPDPSHPRSLENFIHFDTINGYNLYSSGIHPCIFVKPEVLTRAYWDANHLLYSDRKWISECTVNITGGGMFTSVKKGSTILTKDVDYTITDIGDGSFRLIQGIGEWSGQQKIKLKTGYEVMYAGNQHTGGTVPADEYLHETGSTVNVLFSPVPVKTGCTFLGWALTPNQAAPDYSSAGTTSFSMGSKDILLYALWEATISFNSNGGSAVASQSLTTGNLATEPATPVRSGFVFLGWYPDPQFEKVRWNFEQEIVTTSQTLYAKWEQEEPSTGSVISLNDPSPAASGAGWTYANNVYTVLDGADVTVKNTTTTKSIEIPADATAHITLSDAHIYHKTAAPILLKNDATSGADLMLTLQGRNEMMIGVASFGSAAPIQLEGKAKITIEGPGYLKAYGAGLESSSPKGGGAGIGAPTGSGHTAGEINITGGTVVADGGYNASSIGGGYSGSASSVNISGGVVVCETIGGGSHGSSGKINITGGTVYVGYNLGMQVHNGGTVGQSLIGGNAVVFVAHDEGFLSSANVTIAPTATVIRPNEMTFTLELTDMRNPDRNMFNTTAYGLVELSADETVIPNGSTLTVPDEITIDVNEKTLTNDGNIQVTLVNNSSLSVSVPGFGSITNWNASCLGKINGTVYGACEEAIDRVETPSEITLYPVPVKDVLYVGGVENVKSITVRDISGKILAGNTSRQEIATATLAKGLYIVTVETETGRTIKKIIKY
jgi:uncharacterized repeat protein (TIGR02543 family)